MGVIKIQLSEAIIEGNLTKTEESFKELIKQEGDPYNLVISEVSNGMESVGNRYEAGEYFIPEMIRSAKAAKKALDLVKPYIPSDKIKNTPSIVLGTVEGDVHDLGKEIVKTVCQAAGFTVYDLGINVSAEAFIKKIKETNSKILLMSALTTLTTMTMKEVIKNLEESGLKNKIKVIIGGVFVSEEFAKEIGADGAGKNLQNLISLLKSFA